MNEKFTIEFDMRGTPVSLLWKHIATPPGLAQWFADQVSLHDKTLTFKWGKNNESRATILASRQGSYIRLHWEGNDEKTYFELRIETSELTSGTTLLITDFADSPNDKESSIELWEHQIDNLKRIIGCI